MASGDFEPQETKLVRDLLSRVDILVDVGANVGYYCCHALSLGKPVIAIEPITRNLHYLLKNIRSNGWAKQAQVFPVALWRDTEILEMWGSRTGASLVKGWDSNSESHVTLVPVLSLDRVVGDMLHGKRALILIDIEGTELTMLHGAAQTLINDPRPIWMIEICVAEHQPAGISVNPHFAATFEMFFEKGYRAFTVDDEKKELSKETVAEIVTRQYKPELHNFIFQDTTIRL